MGFSINHPSTIHKPFSYWCYWDRLRNPKTPSISQHLPAASSVAIRVPLPCMARSFFQLSLASAGSTARSHWAVGVRSNIALAPLWRVTSWRWVRLWKWRWKIFKGYNYENNEYTVYIMIYIVECRIVYKKNYYFDPSMRHNIMCIIYIYIYGYVSKCRMQSGMFV